MQPRTKGLLALSAALVLGFAAGAVTQDRAQGRQVSRARRIEGAFPENERLGEAVLAPLVATTRPHSSSWGRRARIVAALLALLVIAAAGAGAYGYYERQQDEARQVAAALTGGGNAERGPALMREFGCAGCHTVSGVPGAQGMVGPRLDDVARRVYIAGNLINTPETLIAWIADPKGIDPRTAMPVTGVSRRQARDIAAYLLSMK